MKKFVYLSLAVGIIFAICYALIGMNYLDSHNMLNKEIDDAWTAMFGMLLMAFIAVPAILYIDAEKVLSYTAWKLSGWKEIKYGYGYNIYAAKVSLFLLRHQTLYLLISLIPFLYLFIRMTCSAIEACEFLFGEIFDWFRQKFDDIRWWIRLRC